MDIRYEVSDRSGKVSQCKRGRQIRKPVISSGKMESRTSRSSFCSSRPILQVEPSSCWRVLLLQGLLASVEEVRV